MTKKPVIPSKVQRSRRIPVRSQNLITMGFLDVARNDGRSFVVRH
jgi:hypothetical protein